MAKVIAFFNPDKLWRAKQAVRTKGGDPADDNQVLEEYKKLAGYFKIEESENTDPIVVKPIIKKKAKIKKLGKAKKFKGKK